MKISLLLVITIVCINPLFSQKVKVTSSNGSETVISGNSNNLSEIGSVFAGFGLGYGFFYPIDVNRYLNDLYSGYYMTSGIPDIIMNYTIRGTVGTKLTDNFVVKGEISYSIAPKFIMTDVSDEYYSINRLSPGLLAELMFPISSIGNYIFGGAMVNYNFMSFEGINATCFGAQLRGGMRWLSTEDFFFDVYLIADVAKANRSTMLQPKSLSYNGVQFGGTAYRNIGN